MKRNKQKLRMERICVSLPAIMLENYRFMAAETGLSVSRVILTVLRSKGQNVILLPRLYTDYANKIHSVVTEAVAKKGVTPELKRMLVNLCEQAETARILVKAGE